MSANNFLLIKQNKEHPIFEVFEVDADTGYKNHLEEYDTLEEAVKFAELYSSEEFVEYGTHFELLN